VDWLTLGLAGDNGSFRRVRIAGVVTILGIIVFVTVVDVIDGLFFGDKYHPDPTFYTLLGGLVVTFLGGEAIGFLASKRDDRDERNVRRR
jgi:hypothetical protein